MPDGFIPPGGAALIAVGLSSIPISHGVGGSHDGERSVLVVFTDDAQTVSVLESPGGGSGGWTHEATHTANGISLWLFHKLCGPSESQDYTVNLSASSAIRSVAYLADFVTADDPVRDYDFTDSASGSTVTLPSLSVADGDELWGFIWSAPVDPDGVLVEDPPLVNMMSAGGGIGGAYPTWSEASREELFGVSAPTGTRSYTVVGPSTYENAIAVVMITGRYVAAVGGWAAGMVRMGTN